MYSDQEAYAMMREYVNEGKYKKAYDFCRTYKCQNTELKVSIDCAKQILKIIVDNSFLTYRFNWIDNYDNIHENRIKQIQGTINSRVVQYEIKELRELFGLNA